QVEVGDVILKVNETNVNRFSTKEDPKFKAIVRKHLLSTTGGGAGDGVNAPAAVHLNNSNANSNSNSNANTGVAAAATTIKSSRPEPGVHQVLHQTKTSYNKNGSRFVPTTNGSCAEQEPLLGGGDHYDRQPEAENERLQWQPLAANNQEKSGNKGSQPKFEAYMMTGEHILNISRMPPTTTIVPKQQKKVDNLRYHNSHAHHLRHQQQYNSVPNSPNEMEMGHRSASAAPGNHCRSGPNSTNTSPVSANKKDHSHQHQSAQNQQPLQQSSPADPYSQNNYVRTSRSEDQLQAANDRCIASGGNQDDEDVTSSLNTLLDTRPDSAASSDADRIVWTYNAPITEQQHKFQHALSNGSSSSHSNTSPTSSSPLHSGSPASPTSVSSSVMSSHSGSRRLPFPPTNGPSGAPQNYVGGGGGGGDYSVSEAISNISSPDYHDDDSVGIRDCVMEISDHSDSDSTLLVSEPRQSRRPHGSDHRIVIQVKGPDKDRHRQNSGDNSVRNDMYGYQVSESHHEYEQDDPTELATRDEYNRSSPHSSEDESDVESLHSFHYSPKAVDMPSAIRLAKRLYGLDGFKKSDVSRHLSKNNDFSRAVAEEYLKYFDFKKDTLDLALRKFLKQFSLTGETQERERVLVHFSKRFLDCNPGSFNSQDAVHTLTCAIMLLNTDLHGQNISRKMTCTEFIDNLVGLNEGENFPREVLKALYQAIKTHPLEWAIDEEIEDGHMPGQIKNFDMVNMGGNPFLNIPVSANAVEYKKGYVMRKCCYEANAKRTPFHKRSWKMFYCTLRDLVLYLHKDENGFRKNQMGGDNLHNAIRIHHALATKASDYTKKQYVFRVQTADQAEYLFQTSDSKELQSWIDNINFVCASFSAPPLEAAVGSQKKFQRPLLPCSHTKLNLREQLADHEERVYRLEATLDEHRKNPPEKGSKSLVVQNYKEKEAYLNFELKRYKTYSYMLRSKISQYTELGTTCLAENSIGEVEEAMGICGFGSETSTTTTTATTANVTVIEGAAGGIVPPPIPDRPSPPINRYSYR
ncbi:unnamed protein product, partial [Brassicogethes aeneus]